jgi:hypothetical protein
VARDARHSVDNGASTNTASAAQYGSYPDRYNMQASASYVTGSHAFKIGFQDSWGPYNQNLRANADLYQNYTTSPTTGLPVAATVTLLATPTRWQERLNANLGIYGQDVMTFKRATITLGGRWEYISEQITGQPAQSGRFVNVPAFDDRQMPVWKNFSPRTSIVYDLMGNGKTALRFGYNRFGVAATTTLASLYDPASGVAINAAGNNSAPWTDKNGDDIAQGSFRCNFADPTARSISRTSRPTSASSRWPIRSELDASLRRPVQRRRDARIDARCLGHRRVVPQHLEEPVGAQQRAAARDLRRRQGHQRGVPAGDHLQSNRRRADHDVRRAAGVCDLSVQRRQQRLQRDAVLQRVRVQLQRASAARRPAVRRIGDRSNGGEHLRWRGH